MEMQMISVEKRFCTCCMQEHEVKLVRIEEKNIYKGVPVVYPAEYFYCDATDEIYADERLMQRNDVCMKDAYRRHNELLTSEDIFAIRGKYGISQSDLCTLLGWGGKTITRYESYQVQDRAHDMILKKIDQDPAWFIELLDKSKEAFAQIRYKKYLETARKLYEQSQNGYLQKTIQALYAGICDKEMYTGGMPLSLDRVVDVIRYFSNHKEVNNLYKVKLMKLMWYADFLSYKKRKRAITGLVYRALPMGAVPIGHDLLIDLLGVEYEEVDMGESVAYRFKPSPNKDYLSLTEEDRDILNTVSQKLGQMTKREIVAFMHKERAYKETDLKGLISYQYAEQLLI